MNQTGIQVMRKPIEVWHFILALVTLIFTAGVTIVNQSNRIQTFGDKIFYLEQTSQETKVTLHEISGKLTDILVAMKDKKDREK